MKGRLSLALFSIFLCHSIQASTAQIEGAFGIRFGDAPDVDYQQGQVYTKLGTLYFVDPPTKNEHFDEYAVLVTKTTNQIYSIYAEKEQHVKECATELTKVKVSLEKRYGPATEKEKIYTIKQQQREITLTCKLSQKDNTKASLQLKYTDHQIYQDSLEKDDSGQRDASGL